MHMKGITNHLKRVIRHRSTTAWVALSATGSSILPRSLIILNVRAIYPSNKSVRPDITNNIPVKT